jgi:hypothetical protein
MASTQYSDGRYGTLQQTHLTGTAGKMTVAGTQASASIIDRMACLTAMRGLAASINILVGGTAAAGPVLALQKSLAGTGSGVTFGTYAFNTHADASYVDMTVTETTFASGDIILTTILAGTNAASPVCSVDFLWREQFE